MQVTVTVNVDECCPPVKSPERLVLRVGEFREQTTSLIRKTRSRCLANKGADMEVTISVTQQFEYSLAPFKDKKGNAATVDGTPAWLTDNAEVLELIPSADGMKCVVKAVGMIGEANVQCSVDVDKGEGVKSIIGTGKVIVTAGEATTVELVAGPVTEQEVV